MHSEYRMQVRAGNGATFRSGWNSYNRTVREFNTITYSVFSFYLDKTCQNIIALLGCRSVAKIGAGLWWDSKFEKLQNFYLIQLEPIFQGSVSFKCCWAKTHLKLKTCFLGQNWVEPSGFLVGTSYLNKYIVWRGIKDGSQLYWANWVWCSAPKVAPDSLGSRTMLQAWLWVAFTYWFSPSRECFLVASKIGF